MTRQGPPPSGDKRQRYHHGNLPEALVEAALALVGERGAEALTLRAVAQRVGVSHAAPYRHFKDKQALVSTIAAQGFKQLREALCAARASTMGGGAALSAVTRAYLVFAQQRPAHYRVMYGMLAQPNEHPKLRAEMDNVRSTIQQSLADASADGALSGRRQQVHTGLLYWAQLHGLAALQVAHKLPPHATPQIDVLVTALVGEAARSAAAEPMAIAAAQQ